MTPQQWTAGERNGEQSRGILNSLQAALAATALRKGGERKNKSFSDAVMPAVMDPGHHGNTAKGEEKTQK